VDVCDRRYVFDAQGPPNSTAPLVFDPTGKCPAFVVSPKITRLAQKKRQADELEFAQLVKANVPAAPIYSGLDGGVNKVFLARYPWRNIPLAMVLPPTGIQLPQFPAVPWTDNHGSLTSEFFGAVAASQPAAATAVALTVSTMQERGTDSVTTESTAAPAALHEE
jgi:hypothetical protein